MHHHSLKPKAFPNQDTGERRKGKNIRRKWGTETKKKKTNCGDIKSNTTLVLQVQRGEKKNEKYVQTYKQCSAKRFAGLSTGKR